MQMALNCAPYKGTVSYDTFRIDALMEIVGVKSFYWRSVGTRRYEYLRDSLLWYRRGKTAQALNAIRHRNPEFQLSFKL